MRYMKGPQIHAPYDILIQELDLLLKLKLKPEIYFSAQVLDDINLEEVKGLAERLKENGIPITFHGPFKDLLPGAEDRKVRRASMERIEGAIRLAEFFSPKVIVCHTGLIERVNPSNLNGWVERSWESWGPLVELAEGLNTTIAIENVYEAAPEPIERLIAALNSPHVGFCLDIGHLNVWSQVPLEDWFQSLGRHIKEVHLHDNRGREDEHLPMGLGEIDYNPLFSLLKKIGGRPLFTIEPIRREDLEPALQGFARLTPGEIL